jgi:hypothetical protein
MKTLSSVLCSLLLIAASLLCTPTYAAQLSPKWDQSKAVPVVLTGVKKGGKEARMVREAVRVALAQWATETGLAFEMKETLPTRTGTTTGDADTRPYGIEIVYDKRWDGANDEVVGITHVTGTDDTIKHAHVRINATTWKWPDPRVSLYTLIAHELGHAMGIGHLKSGVMYWAANGLQPPDKNAARELYGLPVATEEHGEEQCEH